MGKEYSTYWICADCAKENGLIPSKYPVTCIQGKCGHCEIGVETTLTPIFDYKEPGGKEPVWD